jgi:hypothetical protein
MTIEKLPWRVKEKLQINWLFKGKKPAILI